MPWWQDPRKEWEDAYKEFGDAGGKLVAKLPIPDEYYEVKEISPNIHFVFVGRAGDSFVKAVQRYNKDHGTNIEPPYKHKWAFTAMYGPNDASKGYSINNRYVVFIAGGPSTVHKDQRMLWDRSALADEMGHILYGNQSHFLREGYANQNEPDQYLDEE